MSEEVKSEISGKDSTRKTYQRAEGRRITKENAREYAQAAAKAKRIRREARLKILKSLMEKTDLGDEVVKCLKSKNLEHATLIEKVLKMAGLHFDQSEDAVQKLDVKSDSKVKTKGDMSLNVTFRDATPEDATN